MTRALTLIALLAAIAAAPAPAQGTAPPGDAVISPDGRRAAWVSADAKSVWSAKRRGQRWSAPEQLLTIRGTVGNLVWAPDSRRIAFENPRGDHGFVAIYALRSDRVTFAAPSFGTDTGPAWSADGRRISFVRHVEGVPDVPMTVDVPVRRQPSPRTEPYALEDALAAPFVSQLTASGDGRAVAYVAREATDRAVYLMRPGGRARRVVNYPGDDGQELQDLAVSRHGDAIAYVRGGDPNDAGEIPNPNSLAVPPQRQVWLSDGGDPRLLGAGSSPQFSPDGGRVVWIDGQRVMSASLQGEPEQLFAFEGGLSMLRFSPDGGRVAYQRSSRIEIRDLATGATTVVANPGGASDSRPSWSPDGTRIAFVRTTSGQPFSIWLADAATGEARQVWQANPGVGSAFYALDQEDQLLWSGDERIAFPWEGDGFRHLYTVPAAGGSATLLTPGEGEVEFARVSRDRARLIYATNIGDIGRRHLAAVGFGGGQPEALTSGRQSQWAPAPLADGQLAYIDAGWADPPAVVVRDASGATTEAGQPRVPSSFPADEMVEPRLIEFPATDGETAYGQLFVPRPERAKRCGVIFPHGGPRRQMLPGFHYIEVYTNLYELNQYLASQGCVVLSVDYRSGIMHGHAFRNAPEIGRSGASEYRDVLAGALYLQSRPDVDPDRIGIHGLSWGGYLVGLALARNSDVFKAGFDQAGVHEFFEDAFPFSPMADIDRWTSPVYLAQGDDDRNVDFDQGVRLARALQSRRPDVELVQRVFPDETHDMFLTFDHLSDLYEEGSRFVLDRLGPAG